jgi:hypothetical protein
MPRILPTSKTDYSLEIRFKDSQGKWSTWINKGKGLFQNIEIVQLQIRLISAPYKGNEIEVRFLWNDFLCDYLGQPTGEVIKFK